jgi:hypothetical protein
VRGRKAWAEAFLHIFKLLAARRLQEHHADISSFRKAVFSYALDDLLGRQAAWDAEMAAMLNRRHEWDLPPKPKAA